jgi:cytochrome P450
VLTLTGNELKQVRTALQGFLRPDRVRRYMSKMDDEVRRHIELNWVGRDSITVCANRFLIEKMCKSLSYVFLFSE